MNKQTQEALKMAIEALERYGDAYGGTDGDFEALQACEEALAQPTSKNIRESFNEMLEDKVEYYKVNQPAQEPIMNVTLSCGCKSSELGFPSEWDGETRECEPCTNYGMLCMTHFYEWEARPAQTNPAPSWQGLNEDEIGKIFDAVIANDKVSTEFFGIEFGRAIEQALKEKNHG